MQEPNQFKVQVCFSAALAGAAGRSSGLPAVALHQPAVYWSQALTLAASCSTSATENSTATKQCILMRTTVACLLLLLL
jgi:hypothetical protein